VVLDRVAYSPSYLHDHMPDDELIKVIEDIDVTIKSMSYEGYDPETKEPLAINKVMSYYAPARVDLELPTEVVDYYRVFPEPNVSNLLVKDIQNNGIRNPVRLYTNGYRGVLRDGHHRLVVAKRSGITHMPVHVIPNWLEKTYISYSLPRLESLVSQWLENSLDFTHQSHNTSRVQLNKRITHIKCSCGAHWRESFHEPWQMVLGASSTVQATAPHAEPDQH
jgi:hypothetical protein